MTFVVRRQDLIRQRPSARRLTAEVSVLGVAALGVFLLRRRGLAPDGGVDPYLVSVPVLLAIGTALIALRVLPWPLRLVGRIAARARGAVLFLGLARAGRGAPVTIGPLAVLVIAITTGVFSGVVASTISARPGPGERAGDPGRRRPHRVRLRGGHGGARSTRCPGSTR